MDEHPEVEAQSEEDDTAAVDSTIWSATTAPMPLSMPPFSPLASPDEGASTEEILSDAAARGGPMPLSMPPFHPLPPAVDAPDQRDWTPTNPVTEGTAPQSMTGGGGWSPPPGFGPDGRFATSSSDGNSVMAPRRRRGVVVFLIALLVAAGVGIGFGLGVSSTNPASVETPTTSIPPSTSTPASASNGALSEARITRLVSPAVVDIRTTVATESTENQEAAAGTGMILSSTGLVLTNNHVIEDAQTIRVTINGRSGSYAASVIGTSATNDVALLRIEGVSGLSTVSFGDSSTVQVGEPVVALGNALGIGGAPTSVPGTISATGRTIVANDEDSTASETLHGLLQTDAEIVPGDSGGPLVNSRGEVIGMDTAAASANTGESVGFAIPINTARALALDIERGETPAGSGIQLGVTPYLGVWACPISSDESVTQADALCENTLSYGSGPIGGFAFGDTPSGNTGTGCAGAFTNPASQQSGALIEHVVTKGPAQNAGIEPGDVITSVAGHPIASSANLAPVIGALHIGERIDISFINSCGNPTTTTVTIGGIPA